MTAPGDRAVIASGDLGLSPRLVGWFADGGVMSRAAVLTDAQWQLIEPLMPSSDGKQGNQFRDHRQVVEGIIYRVRSELAWRDLPGEFGPWQTVWKRHRRFTADATWDRIHTALLTHADSIGEIDWNVSIDSTVNRAHQHGTTLSRNARAQGAWSNHRNSGEETPDLSFGRSRSIVLFDGTTVETEVTITSTTTYRGRTAHHDKKISATTVVSPPALRVSAGAIYSYTTRSLGPFVFDAPYPS